MAKRLYCRNCGLPGRYLRQRWGFCGGCYAEAKRAGLAATDDPETQDQVPVGDAQLATWANERSMLAAALCDRQFIPFLPSTFGDPGHDRISEALRWLFWHGKPTDLLSLLDELQWRRQIIAVGGEQYVVGLLGEVAA